MGSGGGDGGDDGGAVCHTLRRLQSLVIQRITCLLKTAVPFATRLPIVTTVVADIARCIAICRGRKAIITVARHAIPYSGLQRPHSERRLTCLQGVAEEADALLRLWVWLLCWW